MSNAHINFGTCIQEEINIYVLVMIIFSGEKERGKERGKWVGDGGRKREKYIWHQLEKP